MEEIISFHKRNEYLVRVDKVPGRNACIVSYPKRIIYKEKVPKRVNIYSYEKGVLSLFEDTIDSKPISNIVPPDYAYRLLILEHILITSVANRFNTSLVSCFDENGKELDRNKSFSKIMDAPKELEKEKALTGLFTDVFDGKDVLDKVKSLDILEGYLVVAKVFENGGF